MSPAPHSRSRRSAPGTGRGSAHNRLRVFLVVITMVVSVFGVRLFQLQGLDPKAYAARAQQAGAATVVLPARRGTILDRKGVALAESVDGLMLIADPKVTTKYGGMIARILADELGLDYFDVRAKLTKPESRFQYLDRRVPSTLATQVVKHIQDAVRRTITDPDLRKIPFGGVYTEADPLRDYPAKDVAANLVGFLGDSGAAMAGLELAFDKRLKGKDGQETYEVGDGNRIPLGNNSTVEPRNGRSLQLTIDRDLQWYVQRVLRSAVQKSRSDSGSAVVLDTQTGEVLSLADFPTYDANAPRACEEERPRQPGAAGRLRAGLGREGADDQLPPRRGEADPAHPDHRAGDAAGAGPGDPRLVPARPAAPDHHRRARQVLQHRHHAGRDADLVGGPLPPPPRVRPGHEDRGRAVRRDQRPAAGLDLVGQGRPRHGLLRPGHQRQHAADGHGRQRDRQRR